MGQGYYGLFANLISVPVMGFVVMPGAILAAILLPFGLEWIGLGITQAGLAWILGVASLVSEQPGALRLITQPHQSVLPLITLGGGFLCIWQGKWRVLGGLPILAALVIWAQTERPDVLISESGLLIGVKSDSGRILNKPKGDGFTAQNWLENDGDSADQETAALRGTLQRKFGQIAIGNEVLRYDTAKELSPSELNVLCDGTDILVVANIKEAQGPCLIFTTRSLREAGAIAIWATDEGVLLDTTNARRGTRIWVSQ